jgi:hypothetical protein
MFRDALSASGEAAPQLLDIAQLTARGLPSANAAVGVTAPGGSTRE